MIPVMDEELFYLIEVPEAHHWSNATGLSRPKRIKEDWDKPL